MRPSPFDRRAFLAAAAAFSMQPSRAAEPPRLMLANVYRPGIALSGLWVSEKYDGVRGYWDGRQLWSRGGHRIHAPAWFTAGWPAVPLDGELWAGRGQFSHAAATAARDDAGDAAWQRMRYMVFDLPAHRGRFGERLSVLKQTPLCAWLEVVPYQRLQDDDALQALLRKTVRAGGEGLVLRDDAAPYQAERSDAALKLKPQMDAEATVIGHLPGQGKYTGLLGALIVRSEEGIIFRLGSGLNDAQRRDPPAIGSVVTYRYSSLHPNGTPRFATFLRAPTYNLHP